MDADTTSRVNYRIVSGGEGHFNINKNTGVIRVVSPLDYEERQSYSLVVSTDDGGLNSSPDSRTTVDVKVLVSCICLC